jgi:hypothetical protein
MPIRSAVAPSGSGSNVAPGQKRTEARRAANAAHNPGEAPLSPRRIEFDRALLRIEGFLAIAVTSAVVAATAAVGLWWAAMARGAPWFLAGTAPGTHPAAVTLPFVVLGAWLVLTTIVASLGALQVTRALRSA